jgi:hypothetical protein
MLIAPLAGTSIIGATVVAAPIQIGSTTVPLGADAFATTVECLNTDDGCSADISPLAGPPSYPFLPWYGGLTGDYLFDVVLADLREEDIVRSIFDPPIENRTGDDLYIGQARFTSSGLGTFDQNINDLSISVDGQATWQTGSAADFHGR